MNNIPESRLRKLKTFSHGKESGKFNTLDRNGKKVSLIDLASNDYLGLNRHPNLLKAIENTIRKEGVGAGGSRLVTGSRSIHQILEEELGDWLGDKHVLLFPSGFQANIAAVIALCNRFTTVIADRLLHHSLLVGIQATGAKLKRYSHNDLNDLEKHLKSSNNKGIKPNLLVITESLFSMEGTSPDLQKITDLCEKYGANLLVDEAHAIGVMGTQGRGLYFGISNSKTIISGTFGKAFGSGGAFLASDKHFKELLIQTSGAFRYTTALAPPLAAAAFAALELIKEHPSWGEELQKVAMTWRNELRNIGWPLPIGRGPIISLVVGSDQQALDLQSKLESGGLLSVAIRPPTVPEGSSRLRLVIRRNLPHETLEKLLSVLGPR